MPRSPAKPAATAICQVNVRMPPGLLAKLNAIVKGGESRNATIIRLLSEAVEGARREP